MTILALCVLVMMLTIAQDVATLVTKYMITALLPTTQDLLLLEHVAFAVIMMIGGTIQQDHIIASHVIRIAEGAMGTVIKIASTVRQQVKE